jgi:RNA polymerase sigma factor (sigma-70 family)
MSLLDAPTTQPSPEDLTLRHERLRQIERVFEQYLTEAQAAVMIALYLGDMTEGETAEALGIGVEAVKRRRHHALAKLRQVPGLAHLLKGTL